MSFMVCFEKHTGAPFETDKLDDSEKAMNLHSAGEARNGASPALLSLSCHS
jgi:hypothetical protein